VYVWPYADAIVTSLTVTVERPVIIKYSYRPTAEKSLKREHKFIMRCEAYTR